jgi:hypothetical protein
VLYYGENIFGKVKPHFVRSTILIPCYFASSFQYGHVIQHSNPVIIFIFLVSFCVATIAQSFLYSVLFDQANIAAASGGIIYFLLYLPYPFLSNWLNVLPPLVNYFIVSITVLFYTTRIRLKSSFFSNEAF